MRFVRIATKYREQNLLLCVTNSQLYFKCCKTIASKQELRVGYSKEYAQKYGLNKLLPKKVQKAVTKLPCQKIDGKPTSDECLESPENKTKDPQLSIQPVPRTTPTKANDSLSPSKKDRLNTGAIRMRKLALSKNCRTSGPTVRYACCYCSKVYTKFSTYKKHTNIVHSVDIEHKRVKVDANKRLTIEDSVIKKPVTEEESNIDAKKWFVCQKCQSSFSTIEILQVCI